MLAERRRHAFPFGDNPLVGAGFWTARLTAVKVIGRYFGLLLWPARLSFDYSYNENPLFGWGLTRWEDLEGHRRPDRLCCSRRCVALRSFRRNKPVFFSIGFFFATLAPTSNLVILIGSIMAERFLYLPSVGFADGCRLRSSGGFAAACSGGGSRIPVRPGGSLECDSDCT